MAQKLTGPFDELFELTRGAGAVGSTDGPFTPRDPEILTRLVSRFFDDPVQREQIRKALAIEHDGPLSDEALARALAWRIANGGVTLRFVQESRRSGILPGVTLGGSGEIIDVQAPPPEELEERIRDWRLECHHHGTELARAVIERGTFIQVVPDEGQLEDVVKIHYRDDFRTPPPALRRGSDDVPKTGSSGGYDVYDFHATYDGDVDQTNFLSPRFWGAWQTQTSHIVQGMPQGVTVQVFNPRRYKYEFKFPALAGVKAGAKLEQDVEVQGSRLGTGGPQPVSWSIESTDWSPSSLQVNSRKVSSSDGAAEGDPADAILDTVSFSIDGAKEEVAVHDYVASLLNFYTQCMGIVDAIQENAPKVGWYIDFNLQLMQGGVALEWYWKEHTDHRVYKYIDFNVALTIFSVTFELGIGISGLGFKAQVFAQVGGELTVSANAKRLGPDGEAGFSIPAEGEIKGALGARFEAGNLFRAEGTGETGIQVGVTVGINRGGNRVIYLDGEASWTGVEVQATVSGGAFGLTRQRQWRRTLVAPRRLGDFQWPQAESFSPPYLSRDRIQQVLHGVVTSGFNVRVIREREGWFNDEHWGAEQIARALADQIDRHRGFHRTAKMVDGLAHAIRKDLDRLGARWGRDYIEEAAFLSYVRGPELQAHLDDMVNPAASAAAAAG